MRSTFAAVDPSSPQVESEIDFSGAALSQGASRSAQAGALLYLVTITHVDVEAINGESCFNMGTITAEVEVSVEHPTLVPPAS
jgi:hypothetical protein